MSGITTPWIAAKPRNRPSASWASFRSFARRSSVLLPKGLYARSILIVILPMVILQSVLTFIFLQRHCALVPNRC